MMKAIEISKDKYFGMCFVCNNIDSNRVNIHFEHYVNGCMEKCILMLNECFNIQIIDCDAAGELCVECLCQLRSALEFRRRVECADYMFSVRGIKPQSNIGEAVSSVSYSDNLVTSDNVGTIEIQEKHNTTETKLSHKNVALNHMSDFDDVVYVFANDEETIKEKVEHDRYIPHLEDGITICPLCEMEEVTHEALLRHYKTHYPKYMCHICGRGMNSEGHYRIHLKMHTDVRYSCDQCGKDYKSKAVLKEHIKRHHENVQIQKYKCHKCSEKFVNYRTRKKHMFDTHGVACKKFACHLCDKSFFTQLGHRLHYKKIHLNIKDFVCKECGNGFGTRFELGLHMNSHSDERNFSCDVCGKRFKDKKTLSRHRVVHDKVKRFSCSYCSVRFNSRCNALRHERRQHQQCEEIDYTKMS